MLQTDTNIFNRYHFVEDFQAPCPGLECGLRQVESTSYETMATSDAVYFHPDTWWDWDEIVLNRPPGQVWVTGSWESPINTPKRMIPPLKYRNNSFNYVISYRRHEGYIVTNFGKYDTSIPEVPPNSNRNWARGKTKLVAWAASNCNRRNKYLHWNRTEFVRELSSLIQVDMYGKCGDRVCPFGNDSCKFEEYKFYLALENSRCRNYITEKVWRNSFESKLVPIVYGPPREDYDLILPPNSYIFLEDFRSLKDLAEYLLLLDNRDDLYNEYHEWRKLGRAYFLQMPFFYFDGLCEIVARVLKDEKARATGRYEPVPQPDWDSWWLGSCEKMDDYPIAIV